MSTLRTDTLQNAAGSLSVPVATVVQGSAKAWVNFNGTGTVTIRAQFNVSSITDNGEGLWTVNMTNALPNADYAVCASSGDASDTSSIFAMPVTAFTTTSFTLRLRNSSAVQRDSTYVGAAVFD